MFYLDGTKYYSPVAAIFMFIFAVFVLAAGCYIYSGKSKKERKEIAESAVYIKSDFISSRGALNKTLEDAKLEAAGTGRKNGELAVLCSNTVKYIKLKTDLFSDKIKSGDIAAVCDMSSKKVVYSVIISDKTENCDGIEISAELAKSFDKKEALDLQHMQIVMFPHSKPNLKTVVWNSPATLQRQIDTIGREYYDCLI